MSAAHRYQLSGGDLYGLDAGELREHAAAYVARRGFDAYADALVERIEYLTDIDAAVVRADIAADAVSL